MLVVVASSSDTPSLRESSSTTSMSFLCGLPLVLQPHVCDFVFAPLNLVCPPDVHF